MPVVVENDLRAMLHGLHWFGLGRPYRSFALLTIGAGVGIGLVHADVVAEGHAHLAGLTEQLPVGEEADGRTLTFWSGRPQRPPASARPATGVPVPGDVHR